MWCFFKIKYIYKIFQVVDEAPVVNVDISPKSDVKNVDVNVNILKHEEPDIDEDVEADVPATKSTCSNKASKLDFGKKTATKPPLTPQYGNETILGT